MMSTTFRSALAIFALGMTLPIAAQAQQPHPAPPKIRAVNLAKFAKAVTSSIDTIELLDDLTEAKSEANVVGAGEARAESASFIVTYRVPDIELSKSLTNRLPLFGDVPGRTVTTSIRTDCLVSEWYALPGKARDKSKPSTLLIRLAPYRLMTEFPDEAAVNKQLGALRFDFLGDEEKAETMRLELYEDARKVALARYRERRAADGAEFAEEMRAEFQSLHPTKQVRVERDKQGLILGIEGHFSEERDRPAPDTRSRFWMLIAVAFAVISAVLAYRYLRTPTRSSP